MRDQSQINYKILKGLETRLDEISSAIADQARTLAAQDRVLKPISESYGAFIKLGRWGKWILGLILIIISIFVGLRQLHK